MFMYVRTTATARRVARQVGVGALQPRSSPQIAGFEWLPSRKKSMDRRGPRGARTPIAQVRPYEHHSHTAPSVGKKKQSFHFSIIQTVLLGKYNSHVYSRKKTILNITSLHFEIQYKVSKSEISYSLVIRPRLVLKKFYKIFQIPCHIEFLTHEALNIDKNKTNYTV
jgi:hypothetical protein